jgi:hypothetical protein
MVSANYPPYGGQYPTGREGLAVRFKHVISKAGYSDEAVEKIFAEWFEKYMAGDIQAFIKMLEAYEQDADGDPE